MAPDPKTTPVLPSGTPAPALLVLLPSIMLPMFLAVVDQTIVATALPAIAAATGEIERAPWVIAAYLIASTVAAPLYGRLGDSFGRRRMMFVALTVFMITSVLCAMAPTIELLTLARVLQGLGGGGLMTLSQALIGEAVPPRERARYQGYLAAVVVTANTFGPIAGGYLTANFGWPSIFLVNVPIGLLALGLTARLPVRKVEGLPWQFDPGGLVLFSVFVGGTLLSLEQFQRAQSEVLPFAGALLAVGVAALLLLVWHENRTASPLIPLPLLRQPAIWRSDAMATFHGAALVSLISLFPVYLQSVHGFPLATSGLLLIPLTVGIGAGSLITGQFVARTGRTTLFPSIGLPAATASLLVLAAWPSEFYVLALAAFMLWNGLAMGTVMAVVQVTVQSGAGSQRLGEAAASVQFSRSIGAGLGTALTAAVLFSVLSIRNPEAIHLLTALVEQGRNAPPLAPAQLAAAHADLRVAFRAVFIAIAIFTAAGSFLAFTNPLRRI